MRGRREPHTGPMDSAGEEEEDPANGPEKGQPEGPGESHSECSRRHSNPVLGLLPGCAGR